MATLLPEAPSFGTAFARALGGGLSAGASQGISSGMENMQKQKLIQSLLGESRKSQYSGELSGQRGNNHDAFSHAKAAALAGEHDLSRVFAEEAKTSEKQRFAREQAAEPNLLEMQNKLGALEQEDIRFGRLEELFKPEMEHKFPSALSVSLFTKNGQLNDKAAALLSPEAQESVKLITDELSGAKDTFGARVTNFDIATYLKKLPSLLNTAEGRRRVLRDLKLMNQINKDHIEGVLDVVDRYGGPGGISLSKAERIFKKEYAPKMKSLREQFVHPEKATFNSLDDASPSTYKGQKIFDEESGITYESNGKEWVPLEK